MWEWVAQPVVCALASSGGLKLVPLIVIRDPTAAKEGVIEVMPGGSVFPETG